MSDGSPNLEFRPHRRPHSGLRSFIVGGWLLGLLAYFSPSLEAQPVRLQLKWFHQFQFAGYYMAEKQGYFAAEGLDVDVMEGGRGRAPIEVVTKGEAEFGVSDADVLLARSRGEPIVVCAAIFQHSPYVILSRADRGMRTPADLIGRTVMMADSQGAAQLNAMLTREGIDPARVTVIPHSWNLNDLIEGRVDAVSAYATVEPFMMRARGVEPQLLRTVDYGIDFYGDTLFTTEGFAARQPEQVAALVRAVRRGWDYAFDHVEETVDVILALEGVKERGVTREQLLSEAEAMRAFVLPDFVEVGHINRDRWQHILNVLAEQGMVNPALSLDGFIFEPHAALGLVQLRWVGTAGAVGLLVTGAILLWNIQIRRRVRERTAELQAEVVQRKVIEEKLREQARLLDEAHDAIFVRQPDGIISFWNRGAERLYGWSQAEAVGKHLRELLKIEASAFDRAEKHMAQDGEWNGEIKKAGKDGRIRTVSARWTLLRDEQGRPKSVLTIDTDVTEKKELESQFLRAQRLESIGTLAGGIAHDLNNLLAPIVMGVDLLRQGSPDAGMQMVIRNIERSARRGSDLVKQVLSFARGVEGARAAVHLRHIMREAEAMIQTTFPKSIQIECHTASDLRLVMCDPTQIDQVVLNLCVNARDAMPEGGRLSIDVTNVTLDAQQVATGRGVEAGPYVCIAVGDTGTGIAPEIVERIFDPFFTTKEPGKGTGLGLSTVLGIVRTHGGFVNVESVQGQGSTFKVYLPALVSEQQPGADLPVIERLPRGQDELILVVDDEASILEITRQTLEAFGYRVLTAEDGARAIGLFAQHRHEVKGVLTDLMMPIMDGSALIAALRRIDPVLPIIATSGQAATGTGARLEKEGVAFLPKPYSAEAILTLLHRILGQRIRKTDS